MARDTVNADTVDPGIKIGEAMPAGSTVRLTYRSGELRCVQAKAGDEFFPGQGTELSTEMTDAAYHVGLGKIRVRPDNDMRLIITDTLLQALFHDESAGFPHFYIFRRHDIRNVH